MEEPGTGGPGTDGPGSVGPESEGPGTDGPGSVMIPIITIKISISCCMFKILSF